jgi:hypothetical protein
LQFDLGCRFFMARSTMERLVELQFIFENKGFVEHRLYKLTVSVHGFVRESGQANDPGPSIRYFPIRLFQRLENDSLVPPKLATTSFAQVSDKS